MTEAYDGTYTSRAASQTASVAVPAANPAGMGMQAQAQAQAQAGIEAAQTGDGYGEGGYGLTPYGGTTAVEPEPGGISGGVILVLLALAALLLG